MLIPTSKWTSEEMFTRRCQYCAILRLLRVPGWVKFILGFIDMNIELPLSLHTLHCMICNCGNNLELFFRSFLLIGVFCFLGLFIRFFWFFFAYVRLRKCSRSKLRTSFHSFRRHILLAYKMLYSIGNLPGQLKWASFVDFGSRQRWNCTVGPWGL